MKKEQNTIQAMTQICQNAYVKAEQLQVHNDLPLELVDQHYELQHNQEGILDFPVPREQRILYRSHTLQRFMQGVLQVAGYPALFVVLQSVTRWANMFMQDKQLCVMTAAALPNYSIPAKKCYNLFLQDAG